jgi:hypothetical protein
VRRGECCCKSYILTFESRNVTHGLLGCSYPLGYTIVVLPLSIARWSLYDHIKFPSAATFFAVTTWNMSGAINVFLLVLIRPQLLLLTRPECKVNLTVGVETEVYSGTLKVPKTPKTPSSFNSEMPLSPMKECVVLDTRSPPPPSLYSENP